jgi:hypothetical protein
LPAPRRRSWPAVEGLAIGVGTTLTFHCDLVYAAPGTTFRMPFVDLGLVPEAGSSYLLPRRIGLAKATEFLMMGEGYNAAEALRLGLVNAVVESDRLLPHALAQAGKLAAKPRTAVAATRRLIRGDGAELAKAMETEAQAFREALASPAARQAFETFWPGQELSAPDRRYPSLPEQRSGENTIRVIVAKVEARKPAKRVASPMVSGTVSAFLLSISCAPITYVAALAQNDHFGSNRNTPIEIDHILVQHANAAG